MTPWNAPRRLLAITAAAAMFMGTGLFVGKSYFTTPSYAACLGNPGNVKLVGQAGEHPPGGGGDSITGDRGGSR